ncbi:hypothetical protein ACFZCK_16915 [Kitasatospora purpeofusca]|uniref:hypothetical protein n=1 Tax=Kitasatospora purpeofusca TaxID=67352 RepID=UPI0036E4CD91
MTSRPLPFGLSRHGEMTLLNLLAACVTAGTGSSARADVGVRLGVAALVALMVVTAAAEPARRHSSRPAL